MFDEGFRGVLAVSGLSLLLGQKLSQPVIVSVFLEVPNMFHRGHGIDCNSYGWDVMMTTNGSLI